MKSKRKSGNAVIEFTFLFLILCAIAGIGIMFYKWLYVDVEMKGFIDTMKDRHEMLTTPRAGVEPEEYKAGDNKTPCSVEGGRLICRAYE